MSFKHIKFSESPVMRSLEKVALEKGLVKADPIKKEASAKKTDLTPTSNLIENIFKLCSGMREQGLHKEAAELEANYLNYKQAQTLYETSKEKGEDLIGAAHPKGSHKLENVNSDEAVFEDILDKHEKILEKVNKKPTGKLSNAEQIIGAVKKALGKVNIDDKYDQAKTNLQKFRQIYSSIKAKTGGSIDDNNSYFELLASVLDDKTVYQIHNLETSLTFVLANLQSGKEPGFFSNVNENRVWSDEILPMISIADRYALAFQENVKDIRKLETEAKTKSIMQQFDPDAKPIEPAVTQVQGSIGDNIKSTANQFRSLSSLIYSDDPRDTDALQKTKEWLNSKAADLDAKAVQFQGEPDKEAVSNNYQTLLNEYVSAYNKIQEEWL